MSDNENKESFVIYYKGKELHLEWNCVPPLVRPPAIRLCHLKSSSPTELLFLVTADHGLYKGTLSTNNKVLLLELQRNDVIDIDYCSGMEELFIVTNTGLVHKQHFIDINRNRNRWKTLIFDPLELVEGGVYIKRVCCSDDAVLFLTQNNEVYVMGSCGEVFSSEKQPIKMKLFEKCKELLDVVAGEKFFVMLLLCHNIENEDFLKSLKRDCQPAVSHSSQQYHHTSQTLTCKNTMKFEFSLQNASDESKLKALTQSNNSQMHYSCTRDLRQTLIHGHNLLHTQVYTFGVTNFGLSDTGNHMKRVSISNVQKLDSLGVCSISAGREHTVMRTLDGRLYQWDLTSKQQLNTKATLADLSSPTEIKMNAGCLDTHQYCALEACCGDYVTLMLNASGNVNYLIEKQETSFEKTMLNIHVGIHQGDYPILRLLLASGDFTLQNIRIFQSQYHNCLTNLQAQLQSLLKYFHAMKMLRIWQTKVPSAALKMVQYTCAGYERLLYLLAATVHSMESYYRSDFDNPGNLLFIQLYREYIEVFESYTKSYCDIYSIDGFVEAARSFSKCSSIPLMPEHNNDVDLARIFQQPFQIFPVFIQFLDQLVKYRTEFKEHMLGWEVFGRQNCINLELAVNTQEFWSSHERNIRIRHFRQKHRRVILTSNSVHLKLGGNALSMSNYSFILFSDCLCQIGSTLYTYPLCTLWLKIESDTALRIVTPEKNFTLITRTHLDKMLWHDQLKSSIVAALGRPAGSKLPDVRTATYLFSRDHSKYANVYTYGSWKNGVLHGTCYLEFPDGRFYYGEVQNGEIEGYGKMMIPSVGLYEGEFKSGKFHGYGVYEMKENEIYEGNFRDGLFHGHGIMRTNQHTYIGEYQANSRTGYGVLDDHLTGNRFMGMFADNKKAGAGTCITMQGHYFEGIFSGDELIGSGIVVFDNDYYYEGELSIHGPNGKGTYYMPSSICKMDETSISDSDDDCNNYKLMGNVLSGHLTGNWQDVRIQSGSVAINRRFDKYPKSIGELIVDNNRKWRSLFDCFEAQILGACTKKSEKNCLSTEQLWNQIAVFINIQQTRQKLAEQQQSSQSSTQSYFARNLLISFPNTLYKASGKVAQVKSKFLELSTDLVEPRRIHSQETLCATELSRSNSTHSINAANSYGDEISFSSFQLDNTILNSTLNSPHSSFESVLTSNGDSFNHLNNNNNQSFSSQVTLEFVPNFGINTLNEQDVVAIKEYLEQAFKGRFHPLYLLNQRISNCFDYSYGCWKVKPSPILAKQAMREWESISKRIYKFVRKMFPALPEEYCIIENTREVISHITLLYPILLSEGIYSTLFVLYANKYSRKDEIYRQNLLYAETQSDDKLAAVLGLDSSTMSVINNKHFSDAIQMLRQLQEKFNPKEMLTVIENCMQEITNAYKSAQSELVTLLTADNMMPLTVFIVLRAAVHHLGAELALLDDLTDGANFQLEMNGLAGYCYTTIKASYEHVTRNPLEKSL